MISLLHLLLPLLVISCGAFPTEEDKKNVAKVIQTSNDLAVNLHQKLSTGKSNVFFSPLSISTALAMIFRGAKGETANEMRRILGYEDYTLSDLQVHSAFHSIMKQYVTQNDQYQLYLANVLLTQNDSPVRDEYKEALRQLYQADVRDVDFLRDGRKVVAEINDWVKQITRNQIPKLLNDIDPSTILFLLNAVYFKGTWQTLFDAEKTVPGNFYNAGSENSKVTVPLMKVVAEFPYARLGGLKVLELPYKGEDISMLILLPDERNGLPHLEKLLRPNMFKHLRQNLKKREVHLTLPKFKLEWEKNLNDVLRQIGIKSAFEGDADLSGISEVGNLVVSNVMHKAVLEVNEEGSEASAITGVIVKVMVPLPTLDDVFVVDHPFLFAIVDKRNDLILFQGRVSEL